MRVHSKIISAGLGLLLACSGLAGAPRLPREIDEDTAYRLATLYMYHYLSLCGAAQDPVSRGKYWFVPLRIGQGAELYGSVRIDKHTGVITYRGRSFEDDRNRAHETITAQQLEIWAKTPEERHR
jgi:hypothetical protein